MKNWLLAASILLLVSPAPACQTDGLDVQLACQKICECAFVLPSQERVCTDECVDDLAEITPPECIECVLDATCNELAADIRCQPECGG